MMCERNCVQTKSDTLGRITESIALNKIYQYWSIMYSWPLCATIHVISLNALEDIPVNCQTDCHMIKISTWLYEI